ncbi:MAG: PA14 domain-containing protein [Brevinematia bacterium]
MKFDRRHIFLFLVGLFGVFFLSKAFLPLYFNTPIKMTITKQNGDIIDINTPVNVNFENFLRINTIDFPQGYTLRHRNFGNLGFSGNFFLRFNTKMVVKKEGYYVFYVASDDGFRLKINDKIVGEFPSNRPFSTSELLVELKKGQYYLDLLYFQGYGPCGIIVHYKPFELEKKFLLGQNSKYIKFYYPDI